MNILDIIILVPVLMGFVFGLFKGLVRELMSLAAIVLGVVGARMFEPQVTPLLHSASGLQPGIAQALAWLSLFIAIALALLLVARMLDKLFSAIALGGLNKLLGGLFGALKWALLASVLLNVFDAFDRRFSLLDEELKDGSFAYESMLGFGPRLWDEAKGFLPEPESEKDETNENPQSFAGRIC